MLAEERFRQISQLHSQAVDKHLRNQRESTETFSDNHVTEDDADEELIKKVTASYDKQSCMLVCFYMYILYFICFIFCKSLPMNV